MIIQGSFCDMTQCMMDANITVLFLIK